MVLVPILLTTRTGTACMNCARLVHKVSIFLGFFNALLMCLSRCTAPADDLDSSQYLCHSQAHFELLVEEFELGIL